MKKICLTFVMICLCASVFCQHRVVVQNNCKEPIYVAVGSNIKTDNYKGIQTKGWYYIDPGERQYLGYVNYKDVDIEYGSYFYLHAHTHDNTLTWGNKVKLAVSDERFTIRNADYDYVVNNNKYYYFCDFYKIRIEPRITLLGLATKDIVISVTEGGIEYNSK